MTSSATERAPGTEVAIGRLAPAPTPVRGPLVAVGDSSSRAVTPGGRWQDRRRLDGSLVPSQALRVVPGDRLATSP
jgi:hypothetical protein